MRIRHKSDCALHNMPAYDLKQCDCGSERALLFYLTELLRRGDNLVRTIDNGENLTIENADLKVGLVLVQSQLIEEPKLTEQDNVQRDKV